jgi:hypothetical protein
MAARRGRASAASSRTWRERRLAREAEDAALLWRFRRRIARVASVDAILADYATAYCGRPVRRRDVVPLQSAIELPGVTWSIDHEVMVEFLPGARGPGRLVVHDIALLKPIQRTLRSRHVRIEYPGYYSR